jgi:hypothetical protein
MMDPFPLVRIKGTAVKGGARVTILSVSAPARARVAVGCRGHGCPRQAMATVARFIRLRPFERFLPAGVRVEVRVTQPGYLGKYTRLRIRDGKVPSRKDACLRTPRGAPVRCPT